ncbi:S8 family serine peptidase [Paenibacillus azoreducens]|uniref:S8 family serine peptidase n=1 Tax=Paenibacillus azoreducens TaxID=116718 RepID=UPI0039F5509C
MYGKSWIQKLVLALFVFIFTITSPALTFAARDEGMESAAAPAFSGSIEADSYRIDPRIIEEFQSKNYVTYIVKMAEQPDVNAISRNALQWSSLKGESSAKQKRTVRNFIVNSLMDTAEQTQSGIAQELEQMEASGLVRDFHPFYIVNAIAVTSTKDAMEKLAKRPEVEKLVPNNTYKLQSAPEPKLSLSGGAQAGAGKEVPWNLRNISAEQAWKLGFDGAGVVVANMDSGVDGSHPALKQKWRGLGSPNPELSWYDATIATTKFPTDGNGHGTHVMGTMVGSEEDGSNKIGVAPRAQWIAARVFDSSGETSDDALIKAGEWILAPTDKQGNKHPDMAPDVVNNSWGNVPAGKNEFFQDIVKAWIAADIFPAFSAGNTKPPENNGGPGSITAPGNYPESFATGAVDINNCLANFSLQGPTPYGQMKPEVVAPGVNIRSAVPGGEYALMNGTSMASPHTAGVAALIKQANPALKVNEIARILKNTADSLTDQGFPQTPNNGYGWGIINALSAVSSQKQGLGSVTGQVTIDGTDIGSPTIEHEPVELVFNILEKEMFARVKDDVSVDSVELYVREKGKDQWNKHVMLRTSGSHQNGVYEGGIPVDELSLNGIEYYIKATDFSGNATQTDIYPVRVSKGVKIGYTQDFETSIEGFGFSDTSGVWQWGVPTSGPKKAFSGTKVMATVLDGNYPNGANTYFEMPVIDLTDNEHAVLSFTHWYKLGDWWNASYDLAEVFIGGKKSNFQFERVKTYRMSSTKWTTEYIDLSPYKGDQIYVVFNLRGDYGSDEGWYIDDIKIQSPDPDLPVAPKIKVRSNSPGRVILDFGKEPSGKLKEYVIYRKSEPDGEFKEIGTTNSYNYRDEPQPQKGTYYYAVKARTVSQTMSEFSNVVSWTFTGGKEIFGDDFEGPDKGWTLDGLGEEWERGIPHPTKGPKKAVSGQNVWGTNLRGPYRGKVNQSLISPEIDLTEAKHASLYFQQWHEIDDGDQGAVEVSKDNGKTWKSLAVYPKREYDVNHLNRFWYLEELSLDDYAGEKIKFRFRFESKNDSTDFGWYIDDVEVRETPPVMNRISSVSSLAGKSKDTRSLEDSHSRLEPEKTDPLPTLDTLKAAKREAFVHGIPVQPSALQSVSSSGLPIMADVTMLETKRTTRSDAGTGRYTLKHPPGEYTLQVEAYGYKTEERTVNIEENRPFTADVHLTPLAKGKLTGKVTNITTGKPVANASVRLMNDAQVAPAVTNSEGEFELEAYEGDYQLSISALNYLTVEHHVSMKGNGTVTGSYELHGFNGETSDELYYDDGVPDNAKALPLSGDAYAVRMTTNGPAQVTGARFLFWSQGWPNPGGDRFKYAVYDANGPDGLPGKLVAGPYEGKANRNGDWTDVVIHNPVIFNGDFYVAYIQEGVMPNVPGMSMTKTEGKSGRSWKQIQGTWRKAGSDDGDYMIRAKVANVTEEPVITEPVSGTDVHDAEVTVKGTYPTDGTTIQLYRGDVLAGSGVVEKGRFAIPLVLERGENQLFAVAEADGQATSKSAIITVNYIVPAQEGGIQSIAVTPGEVTLKEGEQSTLQVTANVKNENGDIVQMPLKDGLKFASSDNQIANVDETGRVTGISEGTAVITVTYQQWSAQATIHVENEGGQPAEGEVQSITVDPGEVTLKESEQSTLQVTANVKNENGDIVQMPLKDGLKFASSDNQIANVDETGRVTGISEGTAVITVTYQQWSVQATIHVESGGGQPTEGELQSITVHPDQLKLYVGDVESLTVTALVNKNGEIQKVPVTNQLLFASSDDRIAKVDRQGQVSGLSEGIVEITVVYKDKQAVSKVVVQKRHTEPTEPSTPPGGDSGNTGGSGNTGSSGSTGGSNSSSAASGSNNPAAAGKETKVPVKAEGKAFILSEQALYGSGKKWAIAELQPEWVDAQLSGTVKEPVKLDLTKKNFSDYEHVGIKINPPEAKKIQKSGRAFHIEGDHFSLTIPEEAFVDFMTDAGFQLKIAAQAAAEHRSGAQAGAKSAGGREVSGRVMFSNPSGKLTHSVNLRLDLDSALAKDPRKAATYMLDSKGQWIVAGISLHSDQSLSLQVKQPGTFVLQEFAPTFADIATHWGRDEIEVLAAQHILKGTSEGVFTPNAPVTRAQFMAMLDRLTGDQPEGTDRFSMPGGQEALTRAEMASLLVQRITEDQIPASIKLDFKDQDKLTAAEKSSVAYAVEKGWVQGMDGNRFGGDQTSNRAQVAAILYRYMKSVNKI